MPGIYLLRGNDELKRKLFTDGFVKAGCTVIRYEANVQDLWDRLRMPAMLGKQVFFVKGKKLIEELATFVVKDMKALLHDLVIDQGEADSTDMRRLVRKEEVEIVKCDPIWSYKIEDIADWIEQYSHSIGLVIQRHEAEDIAECLGEETMEIANLLELARLSGRSPGDLLTYSSRKAVLSLLDNFCRHKWTAAVRDIDYLRSRGIPFMAVMSSMVTRLELLLRIRACMKLELSPAYIQERLKLSRMIAGNVITEAKMNRTDWLASWTKALVNKSMSDAETGYDWLSLAMMSTASVRS